MKKNHIKNPYKRRSKKDVEKPESAFAQSTINEQQQTNSSSEKEKESPKYFRRKVLVIVSIVLFLIMILYIFIMYALDGYKLHWSNFLKYITCILIGLCLFISLQYILKKYGKEHLIYMPIVSFLILWIIYNRFLRTRIPRGLVTNMTSFPLFSFTYLFLLSVFIIISSFITLLMLNGYLKMPAENSLSQKILNIINIHFKEPYEKCLKIITNFMYKCITKIIVYDLKILLFGYFTIKQWFVNNLVQVHSEEELLNNKKKYLAVYILFNIIPRAAVLLSFLIDVCIYNYLSFAFQIIYLLIIPLLLRIYWYQKQFLAESILEDSYDTWFSSKIRKVFDTKKKLLDFVKEFNLDDFSQYRQKTEFLYNLHINHSIVSYENGTNNCNETAFVFSLGLLNTIAIWKYTIKKPKLIFTIISNIGYLIIFSYYIAYGIA